MEYILTKEKTSIIKGIAILFVIISHCGLMECGGAIGVDLFLIVSGYGIYVSTKKDIANFWKKRITSVYFPYLFTTLVFLIVRYIFGYRPIIIELLVSILGLDFNLNIDPTMWYMFFASTFWTKLQNIFGHCCMSKLDKVAKPRLAAYKPAESHCRHYLIVTA